MYGAIVGDIVGSRFEYENIKTKDFELFHEDCEFTDDTIMTLAVHDALVACQGNYANLKETVIRKFQEAYQAYPNGDYGLRFRRWLQNGETEPYGSWGNGAAMRVSPCGWFAESLEEAKALSYTVTAVTHNHPEGIKGAEATTVAIFLARAGHTKDFIREVILRDYYPINFTLDQIRPFYRFNESSQGTVPFALQAFFESNSFEDAIRNAVSIGGDCDTLTAITGAVADAYYGMPEAIIQKAREYLDEKGLEILSKE